jgi:hypothetical protein
MVIDARYVRQWVSTTILSYLSKNATRLSTHLAKNGNIGKWQAGTIAERQGCPTNKKCIDFDAIRRYTLPLIERKS